MIEHDFMSHCFDVDSKGFHFFCPKFNPSVTHTPPMAGGSLEKGVSAQFPCLPYRCWPLLETPVIPWRSRGSVCRGLAEGKCGLEKSEVGQRVCCPVSNFRVIIMLTSVISYPDQQNEDGGLMYKGLHGFHTGSLHTLKSRKVCMHQKETMHMPESSHICYVHSNHMELSTNVGVPVFSLTIIPLT